MKTPIDWIVLPTLYRIVPVTNTLLHAHVQIMHAHMLIHTHTHTHMYTHMCKIMYAHMPIHTYTHAQMHTDGTQPTLVCQQGGSR